jgi:hypothetical protein
MPEIRDWEWMPTTGARGPPRVPRMTVGTSARTLNNDWQYEDPPDETGCATEGDEVCAIQA